MIGIIGAMVSEVEGIRAQMENTVETEVSNILIVSGQIGSNDVCLAMSGVGKVNAAMVTTVLIYQFECDVIINTGIAGGVAPLKTKDVVLGTKILYNDVDVTAFGYAFGEIPGMPKYFASDETYLVKAKAILNRLNYDYKTATILSGDRFVTSLDAIERFKDEPNKACEMEGAAIAHVCTSAGVPFLSLRYISDVIGQPKQIEDYQAYEAEMAENSIKICLEIIKNI